MKKIMYFTKIRLFWHCYIAISWQYALLFSVHAAVKCVRNSAEVRQIVISCEVPIQKELFCLVHFGEVLVLYTVCNIHEFAWNQLELVFQLLVHLQFMYLSIVVCKYIQNILRTIQLVAKGGESLLAEL